MPAYILYLYTLLFSHCNLYQQSRCLNNANPFFIQSHVQFSTLTTIVCCHRGIHGNLGTKAQTHFVWWWSQTRIQRAITQQSHTPRCTRILQRWHALKDSRRWEVCLSCAHCTLVFTETLCLFCSDYVAFFFSFNWSNNFNHMMVIFLNHRITTLWQHRAVLIVVQGSHSEDKHHHSTILISHRSDSSIWQSIPQFLSPYISLWTMQLHYKLNRTGTSEEAWKGAPWPLSHFCSLIFVSAVCLQAVVGQRIGLFSAFLSYSLVLLSG